MTHFYKCKIEILTNSCTSVYLIATARAFAWGLYGAPLLNRFINLFYFHHPNGCLLLWKWNPNYLTLLRFSFHLFDCGV